MEQAAAAAEVRGEGEIGEVFGRPLSDFDETPPVLLECMGYVAFLQRRKTPQVFIYFWFLTYLFIDNPVQI